MNGADGAGLNNFELENAVPIIAPHSQKVVYSGALCK
jgi:hypothetical protein